MSHSHRHPGLITLLIGVLICPRRTGRVLAGRGLVSAIVAHLIALAAVVAAAMAGAAMIDWTVSDIGGPSLLASLKQILSGVGPAVMRDSTVASLTIITVLVCELLYWSTTLVIFSCWFGVNARPRRLVRWAAVAAGFGSIWLAPLTLSWAAAASMAWLLMGPTTAFGSMLPSLGVGICGSVLPALMIAMMLRVASGMGDVLPGDAPGEDPLCERCGYNLRATAFEGCCPECGLPAKYSLSPIHRCSRWETGRAGYFRTMAAVIARPSTILSTIRTRYHLQSARRFLVISTLLSTSVFAVLAGIASALYRIRIGSDLGATAYLWGRYGSLVVLGGVFYGGIWAATVPILSMFTASCISSAARRRGDPLGMRGAVKIACYLSGLAVGWALIIGAVAVVAMAARVKGWIGYNLDPSHTLMATVIAAGLLMWYWQIADRAYAGCRYANT